MPGATSEQLAAMAKLKRENAELRETHDLVLELVPCHDPVRYRDLVCNPGPRRNQPYRPGDAHPPSIDRPEPSNHGEALTSPVS